MDLSIHPAGCEDWRFYERLCLKVADRLDTAIVVFWRTDPEPRPEGQYYA